MALPTLPPLPAVSSRVEANSRSQGNSREKLSFLLTSDHELSGELRCNRARCIHVLFPSLRSCVLLPFVGRGTVTADILVQLPLSLAVEMTSSRSECFLIPIPDPTQPLSHMSFLGAVSAQVVILILVSLSGPSLAVSHLLKGGWFGKWNCKQNPNIGHFMTNVPMLKLFTMQILSDKLFTHTN